MCAQSPARDINELALMPAGKSVAKAAFLKSLRSEVQSMYVSSLKPTQEQGRLETALIDGQVLELTVTQVTGILKGLAHLCVCVHALHDGTFSSLWQPWGER